MIGEPPVEDGAVHVTSAFLGPAAACTSTGAPGACPDNVANAPFCYRKFAIPSNGELGDGPTELGRAQPARGAASAPPADGRAEYAGGGIHFHDTYVGAATVLHARGLISEAGLRRVVDEALRGLDAVRWSSPAQERALRTLVERDVAASGI